MALLLIFLMIKITVFLFVFKQKMTGKTVAGGTKDVETMVPLKYLKAMKRAASCKHRQAIKLCNVRRSCSNLTYIFLKLRKCVKKHTTSTHQKMATRMENLLVRLLF